MKPAIASLSLLLAACNAPQPTVPAPAPEAAAPAPAAAQDGPAAPPPAPMGKRAPGDASPPLQVFRAFGNEPFWNVNVEGETLTYSTPDDQAGVVLQGTRRAVPGGVEIAGSHDGKAFALTVTEGECSDGMSDNVYALEATFRYGDLHYSGCGEAAK